MDDWTYTRHRRGTRGSRNGLMKYKSINPVIMTRPAGAAMIIGKK